MTDDEEREAYRRFWRTLLETPVQRAKREIREREAADNLAVFTAAVQNYASETKEDN